MRFLTNCRGAKFKMISFSPSRLNFSRPLLAGREQGAVALLFLVVHAALLCCGLCPLSGGLAGKPPHSLPGSSWSSSEYVSLPAVVGSVKGIAPWLVLVIGGTSVVATSPVP